MQTIRVAVASKGGQQIDEHFGHAEAFGIYDIGAEGVQFIEGRSVGHYCQGGYGDDDKWSGILRALADCAAIFVARIGNGPRQTLADAGIRAVDDYPYGAIGASLQEWRKSIDPGHEISLE